MIDQWMALRAKRDELELQVRKLDREMEAVAASMFLEHLRTGKWKVEHGRLCPADGSAEDATVNILSDALRLGYHDRFSVHDGRISISGFVDDGHLTLSLHLTARATLDEVQAEAHLLRVNMDLTPLLRKRLERELETAVFDAARVSERTAALQKALTALGEPPPESA